MRRLTGSGWFTDANAGPINLGGVVHDEGGGRGATPLAAPYRVLRVFPVPLEKVEVEAIVADVSGNGQRKARTRVTDNGWTRHDSRSKHDERYKKGDQKHDQRLEGMEGRVGLSLEIESWQTLLLKQLNRVRRTRKS